MPTETCPDCGRPLAKSVGADPEASCFSSLDAPLERRRNWWRVDCYELTIASLRSRLAESTRAPAVEAVELAEAEWIRCEERMPAASDTTELLFFVTHGNVFHGTHDGPVCWTVSAAAWLTFPNSQVTHWMPLPAPPKNPTP